MESRGLLQRRAFWFPMLLAICAVAAFFGTSACAAPPDEADANTAFKPDFSKASLILGSQVLAPIRVREAWPVEEAVGNRLVRIKHANIECVDIATDKSLWTAKSEDGWTLAWLGEHKGQILLAGRLLDENGSNVSTKKPCVVRRIRIDDGTWMSPLTIPLADAELAVFNDVQAALGDVDGILTVSVAAKDDSDEERVSYRVTRFKAGDGTVAWSKVFPSAGTLASPGAFILGTWGPARDNENINPLAILGSDVLVCAGPKEDLLTLDRTSGETKWSLPRLWEFRRGFIGPSVWQHFVSRFGVDDNDLELAEMTLEQLRENNKTQQGQMASEDYYRKIKERVDAARARIEKVQGSIVAGPAIVSTVDEFDRPGLHIFVATARCAQDEWPNYLSDCVIYEIDGDGRPIGTVTLPAFVRGTKFSILHDSVVWCCERGSLAKLYASPDKQPPAATIPIDWRSGHAPDQPKAWMTNGQWFDAVEFIEKFMLRIKQGGYVDTRKSQVYQFPISVTNLNTGAETDVVLSIPFEGTIKFPETNYSGTEEAWTSYDAPLVIRDLAVRGSVHVISVETRSDSETAARVQSLEFDFKEFFKGE